MRRITSIIIFLMFSILLFSEGAVLRNISGKVEVSNNGNGNWKKAIEGMTVELSDTISTGFGAAATLDLGYSKIALKPLTRMSVDMFLETKNKVSTSLFLQVGSVKAEVDSSSGIKQSFQVQSPFSTASVRGTVFEFDGRKLSVVEGTVALFVGKPKRIVQKQIMRKKKEKEEVKAEEESSKTDDEATATEEDGEIAEDEAETTSDKTPSDEPEPSEPTEEPKTNEAAFLEAIEQEVAQQQTDFDDSKAIFVSQGQSVEVIVALTPVKKEDKKKDQEEEGSSDGEEDESTDDEEEPEAKVLTEADTVASKSLVIADTSVVSTAPTGSDDTELETPEVYIPEVTKPSQTDITIIWNDNVRGDDNEN